MLIKQGGVLRGVHGEGEEDGKDVCHEVCEEETENRPQSGERDHCDEKVNFFLSVFSVGQNHNEQLFVFPAVGNMLEICEL